MKPGELVLLDGEIAIVLEILSPTLRRYLCGGEVFEVEDYYICPSCRCTDSRENIGSSHSFCWKCEWEEDWDDPV